MQHLAVIVVFAGIIHRTQHVQEIHAYRLDVFDSEDADRRVM